MVIVINIFLLSFIIIINITEILFLIYSYRRLEML